MYIVRSTMTQVSKFTLISGHVFSWGLGSEGQLGHGDKQTLWLPRLIEELESHVVTDIACGSAHAAAIDSNGELFTWGLGSPLLFCITCPVFFTTDMLHWFPLSAFF